MESRLYLILDLLVFLGPLTRAFEPRIFYIGKWKRLLAATMAVWALFLPWDAWFTAQGVWGFSALYLVGWNFVGLPLEEILFFVVVPWACYFIFEVMQLFFPGAKRAPGYTSWPSGRASDVSPWMSFAIVGGFL